jgi:hypothetical protein
LVHYILDGLTLCGDVRARNWTENPNLASCPGCRLLLSHVGAYDARAAALLAARGREPTPTPVPVNPLARLRAR